MEIELKFLRYRSIQCQFIRNMILTSVLSRCTHHVLCTLLQIEQKAQRGDQVSGTKGREGEREKPGGEGNRQ